MTWLWIILMIVAFILVITIITLLTIGLMVFDQFLQDQIDRPNDQEHKP